MRASLLLLLPLAACRIDQRTYTTGGDDVAIDAGVDFLYVSVRSANVFPVTVATVVGDVNPASVAVWIV